MNQAPTAGFEEDVGARTTHHVMYPERHLHSLPVNLSLSLPLSLSFSLSLTLSLSFVLSLLIEVEKNLASEMITKGRTVIFLLSLSAICFYMRRHMLDFFQLQVTGSSQCINKRIEPFLSPNHKLSLEAFDWWKNLQFEKRSLSVYQSAVDNLFKIFPPIPDVPDRCGTCAVVGNSGGLRGSRYGRLIDAHDAVMRMNLGPTEGYEEDVGTKTTHRIMYPESAMDLDNTTHLVLFPFKIQDIEWLNKAFTTGFSGTSYRPVKSTITANKSLVMVVSPAFMMYVHHEWLEKKGRYPSTGFMALVLALHVCDQVSFFGFGADSDGNWSHYFEILKYKNLRTGPHAGIKEYEVIQELQKREKIQFFKGQ
ncbi:unnamed protein product [Lampetra planeri]